VIASTKIIFPIGATMTAASFRLTRLFLAFLTIFLSACTFTVSLDAAEKIPTPHSSSTDCQVDDAPGQAVVAILGVNVAQDKKVISRSGGVDWPAWGGANDSSDYATTTRAEKGRWGHQTNTQDGTYEVVDLGRIYSLNGVGYSLDWDAAYTNSLTMQVLVSLDNGTWMLVANTVHVYSGGGLGNHVNVDLAIVPVRARYVKYWLPPDGGWNGWGDFFQLRAYGEG
jgi:hypothetical protein